MSNLSPAAQQYVRAIYDLQQSHATNSDVMPPTQRVTTSELADSMGLRAASITAMLQKLAAADPPLIQYTKHQGALLTRDGRRAALALVRRHRLLETYLHERLDFGWDEVHDEAQRLGPVVNDALAERLAEALGQPTRDPHGHAIPGPDLSVETAELLPLTALPEGVEATVAHVSDTDPDILRYLAAKGLHPDTRLTILHLGSEGQPMELQVGRKERVVDLPAHHADHIFVTTPLQPFRDTGVSQIQTHIDYTNLLEDTE